MARNEGTFWNFWPQPEVTGHYKKFTLYISGKKMLDTAGNLKVKEQSKYKSVPILFLFLVIEGKPEIRNS